MSRSIEDREADLNEALDQDPFYRNLGSEGARALYREYKRQQLEKTPRGSLGNLVVFADWLNSDPAKDFRHGGMPDSTPIDADELAEIYAAEERRKALGQTPEEFYQTLDPDPDLTDGDDDLQNGTVPPPSDNFNESLRANVEALDEAFNQIITQLEERGVPEEEIEAFRKAVTPVYEEFGSRTMGQPPGSIPIDIPDSPMPKWELPGISITYGDPDNPNSGNDNIYITLNLDLPVIGPLLETLGVGGGKIYLRKDGKWSTPGGVLERVGGIFTDILKTPKAILDEAKKIIEGIEDGTVFEGIKREEGLFADLLKKWLIGRYPWFEDEWFKDFIKQTEEIARDNGLIPFTDINTEETCTLEGWEWNPSAKNGKGGCELIYDDDDEADPEVTEDVVPPPEKTEEECLAEGNDWDGEKCVFVPDDEKKAKCLARGGTWENGQCTLPPVDPQQVCAQRGGRWDPLANNGEGKCVEIDDDDDDPVVPPPPPPPEGCPIDGEVRDPKTGKCGPLPPPPPPPPGTCPANSTPNADGGCDCNAGYVESVGENGELVCQLRKDDDDDDDDSAPPTSGGGGGGGGGGMFSPQPVNPAGGINYALPTFVNVAYEPKDYVASLNNVIQESLFEGMI